MSILSIQSSVAYGHVGNSAAVFPLQRLGVEVWPVHTVHFSNHTGYGEWRGPLLPADDVRAVIQGVEERGAFPEVAAVLSGYQGGEDIGGVILEAVERVKAANPAAIYACDPVMGNAKSGCFVHPAIPVLLRDRVVPRADLITPNQFELGYLTDTDPHTLEETIASVEAARSMGPATVLVTSVLRPDAPDETVEMLAVHGDDRLDRADAAAADEGERLRRRHGGAVHRPPAGDRRTRRWRWSARRRACSTCCGSPSTAAGASSSWCRRRSRSPTRRGSSPRPRSELSAAGSRRSRRGSAGTRCP